MPAETFLRSAPLPLPNLSFMRLLPRPTAFLDLARTMVGLPGDEVERLDRGKIRLNLSSEYCIYASLILYHGTV